MAFWIEMHCDRRFKGRKPGTNDPVCHTDRNDNPAIMVRRLAGNAMQSLYQQAQAEGWKHVGGQWFCPHCRMVNK